MITTPSRTLSDYSIQKPAVTPPMPTRLQQAPAPPPLPPSFPNFKLELYTSNDNLNRRINWEKIENNSLEGTVWEKIKPSRQHLDQVITNLNIDHYFTVQKQTNRCKFII